MPDTAPTTSETGDRLESVTTCEDSTDAGTTSCVAPENFLLNHPKNYFAVPLAISASASTDFLIREYAVNLPDRAVDGAVETGLIRSVEEAYPARAQQRNTCDSGDVQPLTGRYHDELYHVTPLGEAVIVTGTQHHGSVIDTLTAFQSLFGSPKRFVKAFPHWRSIAQRTALQYELTAALVEFLRRHGTLSLTQLSWLLLSRYPDVTTSVFFRSGVDQQFLRTVTEKPLHHDDTALETIPSQTLSDTELYDSRTVFQFKSFLYHCGITTTRGAYSTSLTPDADTWALDTPIRASE